MKLAVAVVSITSTKRRRFFWAAWWTAAPLRHPFRKPDASNGGSATPEDALREAEKMTGRTLVVTLPLWARAWNRVLRGMPPWTARDNEEAHSEEKPSAKRASPNAESMWSTLGLESNATPAEIKIAFRKRALETHSDHGGDPAAFRAVKDAYERALKKRAKPAKKRRER